MSAPAQAPSQPPRVKRSQFIEKLHDLLEHPYDPDSLRWTPDGEAFEITTNEPKARNALSPKWDFRSLSSFIRQLSYYNFKRLSDRRRSTERRGSSANYIVFSHPTGFFVKGDNSKLDGIVRKTRTRPADKPRRDSLASTTSADDTAAPSPFPLYEGGADMPYGAQAGPSYATGSVPPYGMAAPGQTPRPYQPPSLLPDALANWRSYQAGFQGLPPGGPPDVPRFGLAPSPMGQPPPQMHYDYSAAAPPQGYRRGSLSEFKVGVSPRTKPADLPGTAAYQTTMRTHSPLGLHDAATAANGATFHSPYPTPTFPSQAHPHSGSVSHDYLYPSHALPAQGESVPSGLPAPSYDPQGHRSSYPPSSTSGYAPMPPTLQPPTISTHLPSHLQAQPHLAAGAPGPEDVLPSPTYSSEEDGGHPPRPAASSHAFFPPTYPSAGPPPQGSANPFPHLTHLHPPTTHGHPHAHAHAHGQGLAPLQIPPFGPGPGPGPGHGPGLGAAAAPSPQSAGASAAPSERAMPVHMHMHAHPHPHSLLPPHPHPHPQQQQQQQQQQGYPHAQMAQKLGWAPPAPGGGGGGGGGGAGPAGAGAGGGTGPRGGAAGVFSNWQGFGTPQGAVGGGGGGDAEERGAGAAS
ncbi:hypothetical protein JCM3770_002069 [Rhodotorula araucariae]